MSQKNIKITSIGIVKQNKKVKYTFDIPNNSDFYHCHSYVYLKQKTRTIFWQLHVIKLNLQQPYLMKIFMVYTHPETCWKFG